MKAERKKQKRLEAEQRKVARSNRSDAEQLALIQGRRGKSLKETERLSKRLSKKTMQPERPVDDVWDGPDREEK